MNYNKIPKAGAAITAGTALFFAGMATAGDAGIITTATTYITAAGLLIISNIIYKIK